MWIIDNYMGNGEELHYLDRNPVGSIRTRRSSGQTGMQLNICKTSKVLLLIEHSQEEVLLFAERQDIVSPNEMPNICRYPPACRS